MGGGRREARGFTFAHATRTSMHVRNSSRPFSQKRNFESVSSMPWKTCVKVQTRTLYYRGDNDDGSTITRGEEATDAERRERSSNSQTLVTHARPYHVLTF